MSKKRHNCVYGMYIGYDGYIIEVYKEGIEHCDPMDTEYFDYCPFCGRRLVKEEENPND